MASFHSARSILKAQIDMMTLLICQLSSLGLPSATKLRLTRIHHSIECSRSSPNRAASTARPFAGEDLMSSAFTVAQIENFTVVEFITNSLMNPVELEEISNSLYKLVDEQDRRRIILDFEKVQYLSSQAIGIVMALRKKLSAVKGSRLILCSVGPTLMQLLKITGLDRLLMIKPTQREALKVWD
jgi:anti-sigma B factor antagonist